MAEKALVPFDMQGGAFQLPSVFGPISTEDFDALTNGVSVGYAVLSFRGKVWRVRHSGDEHILRDKEGNPLRKLNCIIVGSNPALSKTFYEGAYEPGSNNPPDCASIDGIKPDVGVANPQSISCATCHNNQYGSKITEAGKKLKACTDSRRLAVVPYPDIENETYGGPMLLRVPPASLESLAKTVGVLKANMVPPHAAVIEVAFDLEAEYPLLTFTPRAAITSNEVAARTMAQRKSDVARQIMHGVTTALPLLDSLALPPTPMRQAQVAQPAPAAPAKTRKPKAAAPAPVPEPVDDDEDEDDLGLTVAPKVTGKRVENQAAPAPATVLDDDDDDDLSDVLAGLDA